ncbi:MAG: DUF3078 domain-containing protein [Bacteroidota bacterium]|nr:DUF3078 domain-containing protein [Bacteroidota bacterium]
MRKLFIFLLIIVLSNSLIAQISNSVDSVKLKKISRINSDTIKSAIKIHVDSIPIIKNQSTRKAQLDSLTKRNVDSINFIDNDTLLFVISNLKRQLNDSVIRTTLNDSVYKSISKLIKYHESKNIKKVSGFLQKKIEQNPFLFINIDILKNGKNINFQNYSNLLSNGNLSSILKNDSIIKGLSFLLSEIKEPPMLVSFSNNLSDSIFINLNNNKSDSSRLNIYDNRKEFANLWIKNLGNKNIDISFEDGVYINRPKQKKTVNKRIANKRAKTELRKIRKTNIIVPIWKIGGETAFKFNQGYLSNWVQGGESSLSGLSISKYHVDYTYGKKSWNNNVEYRYGLIKIGENNIRKNDDKLEISSKYGQEAFNDWYYSAMLSFKSQLFKGYDYPNDSIAVSGFLAPGSIIFSFGLDYKPNKNLTILVSPLTSKFTIVRDTVLYDQTKYGLLENEKVRKEIGAYIKARYKVKIMNNINLENKVNFFTNYSQNLQNVDVDWELLLDMKVNEFISVSVNTHFIYDDDIDIPVFKTVNQQRTQVGVTKKVQFKEILGVGFLFKF